MARKMTEAQKVQKQIMAALDELGGRTVGEDNLVFNGTQFVLPEDMEGNIGAAIKYLGEWEEQQERTFEFSRTFNYRPWDGANAFQSAMRRVFGSTGIGQSSYGMFGEEYKPQLRTVNASHDETIQVPWGRVSFSPLNATFVLGATRHEDYGVVFQVEVEAPRKHRNRIEAFFKIVEDEVQRNSIYRGKAITGGLDPNFLDTSTIDRSRVIYSDEVMTQLETNMWSLIRHTETLRKNRIPLKRAVLVEGPYGTGKTLSGMLTAQEAVANGWTFILCRPGKDELMEVLQTAQLYAPAVVWFEDIDVVAQGTSDTQISKLLDVLDGISNKGSEVLAGFTTNHVQKIQKGVLRPGRLDAVIHIGKLDGDGFAKLIQVTVPDGLLGDVDYHTVARSFDGMLPAFAKEAVDRALRSSIARHAGEPHPITTEDLVNAAASLRPQLALMADAQEGARKLAPLDRQFRSLIADVVDGAKVLDYDGDPYEGGVTIQAAE